MYRFRDFWDFVIFCNSEWSIEGGGRVQKVGRIYKSGWGKLKLKINKNGVKYVYPVFKYKYKLFPTWIYLFQSDAISDSRSFKVTFFKLRIHD